MHKKIGIVGLLATIALLPALGMAQEAIHWESTLENAQRLAGQTNRLVLVQFVAPWCGYCKRMETEVLSQPALAAVVAANYVAVKVNAPDFPITAQKYGVTNLPTTVIMTPQGKVLDTIQGLVQAAELSARLNQVAAMAKQSGGSIYAQLFSAGTNTAAATLPTAQTAPAAATPPNVAAQNLPPLVVAQNLPPLGGTPPSNLSAGPSLGPAAPSPTSTAPISPNAMTGNRYADYYRGGQTGAMTPIAQPQTAMAAANVPQQPSNYQPSIVPSATGITGSMQSSWAAAPSPAPSPSPAMGAYGAQPPSMVQPGVNRQPNNPTAPWLASRAPVQLPAGNAPLGLEGFCPVTLAEKQQWVPGDRRWGVQHRGRTYLFSGPEEQRRFFADPDRYAPAVSGNDVVLAAEQGQVVPGTREHGVFFGTRVYLFANEATLEKFSRNPNQYANQALGRSAPDPTPASRCK